MGNVPDGAQLSEDGQWWWDGAQWQAVQGGGSVETAGWTSEPGYDSGESYALTAGPGQPGRVPPNAGQALEDAWDYVQEKADEAWGWATGDPETGATPTDGGGGGEGAPPYYDGGSGGYGDGGLPPGGVPEQQTCGLGPCPACAEDQQMSSPCVYQAYHGGDHECAYGDIWQQDDASAIPQRVFTGTPVATALIDYNSSTNHVSATGNTVGWPRGRIEIYGEIFCDGDLVKRLERSPCENETSCTLPNCTTEPEPGTRWSITVVAEGPRYAPVSDTSEVTVPD